MHKRIKAIVVASAVAAGALVGPMVAHAASGCYAQGRSRIHTEHSYPSAQYGQIFYTDDVRQAEGTRCDDINVRDTSTASGVPMPRYARVNFYLSDGVQAWHQVNGWTVLAYNVPAGSMYRIEFRGEGSGVTFATPTG